MARPCPHTLSSETLTWRSGPTCVWGWGVREHPWEDLGNVGKGEGEGAKARAGPWGGSAPKMGKPALIKKSGLQNFAGKPECLRAAFAAAVACSSLFGACPVPTQRSPLKLSGRFPISTNWGKLFWGFNQADTPPLGSSVRPPARIA